MRLGQSREAVNCRFQAEPISWKADRDIDAKGIARQAFGLAALFFARPLRRFPPTAD